MTAVYANEVTNDGVAIKLPKSMRPGPSLVWTKYNDGKKIEQYDDGTMVITPVAAQAKASTRATRRHGGGMLGARDRYGRFDDSDTEWEQWLASASVPSTPDVDISTLVCTEGEEI